MCLSRELHCSTEIFLGYQSNCQLTKFQFCIAVILLYPNDEWFWFPTDRHQHESQKEKAKYKRMNQIRK